MHDKNATTTTKQLSCAAPAGPKHRHWQWKISGPNAISGTGDSGDNATVGNNYDKQGSSSSQHQ